jgi:hypothetical protein
MRKSVLAALSIVAAVLPQPAHAVQIIYRASLDAASESPPVVSPGTGSVQVTFDTDLMTMTVAADFADLVGVTTVAHIHCCTIDAHEGTAGVATYPGTFPGWPVGVTSGDYLQTFDMSLDESYTPAFLGSAGGTVAGAFDALLAGLDGGRGYFNIHTDFAPAGEIRGFLVQAVEPGTLMLLGLGLIAIGLTRMRRGN